MSDEKTNDVPFVLLPYQQAWVSDDSPVKVCEKSRRVGLSWAEAADDALYAASGKGDDVWYVGYNQDMAREFIEDCAAWSRQYQLAAGAVEEGVFKDEERDITVFRIRYASGHKITALSSRPSNLRGKQGRVVIDEAAFHPELDQLIKAAMALLMWGGSVRIISTHNGDANPFNEMVQDIRAGKKKFGLHRVTFDDALGQGLYQRICLTKGRDWSQDAEAAWKQEMLSFYGEHAGEELNCIPSQGKGAWVSRALIESCMSPAAPVLRWSMLDGFAQEPEATRKAAAEDWFSDNVFGLISGLKLNNPCYFGEDFGRSGDLTVLAVLQEEAANVFRSPFVIELRNIPFQQQWQVVFLLGMALPRFSGAAFDARGNGQYLAELSMQAFGAWRIHQVMLSAGWYLENMPPYKAALEDRSVTWPLDPDIVDDHRALRMEKGYAHVPDGYRSKGRDGGQRHGDSAIACPLAYFAARNTQLAPMEFEVAGESRASAAMEDY